MSWSQTDKHTHTALHTRTPPPRLGLGRRETRGWSSPKEGIKTRMEGKGSGVTLPGSPGQPRPFEAGR